jgi:hypothetical protein
MTFIHERIAIYLITNSYWGYADARALADILRGGSCACQVLSLLLQSLYG